MAAGGGEPVSRKKLTWVEDPTTQMERTTDETAHGDSFEELLPK